MLEICWTKVIASIQAKTLETKQWQDLTDFDVTRKVTSWRSSHGQQTSMNRNPRAEDKETHHYLSEIGNPNKEDNSYEEN